MSVGYYYKYRKEEEIFDAIVFKVTENLKYQVEMAKAAEGELSTCIYISKEIAVYRLSENGFNGSVKTSKRILEYIFHICSDDKNSFILAKSAVEYAFLEIVKIFSYKMPLVSYKTVKIINDEINNYLSSNY